VKQYRSSRELIADVERTLSARSASTGSPLDEVIEIISDGRHYAWTAIYLAERDPAPVQEFHAPSSASGVLRVPVKAGQRLLGVLEVEAGKRPITRTDTLLLRQVAADLGRFLTGRGKYLMRKVREMGVAAEAAQAECPKLQPVPEKGKSLQKRAAAGESRG
jgi:hypothetical protein